MEKKKDEIASVKKILASDMNIALFLEFSLFYFLFSVVLKFRFGLVWKAVSLSLLNSASNSQNYLR